MVLDYPVTDMQSCLMNEGLASITFVKRTHFLGNMRGDKKVCRKVLLNHIASIDRNENSQI